MSSSRLSDLSWAELREQARRIGRRWIPEELPIAQEEVMPKETDGELPMQLSNLSWAELRERARRIGRRWSSEELPTGNASTGEEQPPVVQVDSHGDIERRAEQPDVEEVLTIEPPATKELPNVTNKQQQLPTTLVTMTATSSSTSLAAIEQPSKATEATVAIVSEEEGERTNASKEEQFSDPYFLEFEKEDGESFGHGCGTSLVGKGKAMGAKVADMRFVQVVEPDWKKRKRKTRSNWHTDSAREAETWVESLNLEGKVGLKGKGMLETRFLTETGFYIIIIIIIIIRFY
ncbi:unnamed protein product [Linum trigynum]|uniref:Uncharacterized protein n=1 Tax=Linum trigynum TaxID=586398 RepID=A0AAV2CYI2_9ROSI